MSKTYHQVSVPDWVWEWGQAHDPKGRTKAAPYLRELLLQTVAGMGGQPAVQPKREQKVKSSSQPKIKRPLEKQHSRTVAHAGKGTWTFNERLKEELDGLADRVNLKIVLTEYDGRPLYTFLYNSRLLTPKDDGQDSYWIIDAAKLCKSKAGVVKWS